MVGHPVLRKVVGADLLAAVARADLPRPELAALFGKPLLFGGVETAAKQAHRKGAVFELATFRLARDDGIGGNMRDADGGFHFIDVLAARAAAAVGIDAQIRRIDDDINLLGLGKDGHGRSGGMDAPLRFGRGDALHPVHARFVLELPVDAGAIYFERGFLDAARVGVGFVEHLGLPPLLLGVPQVHAHEFRCEE